MRGTMNEGVQDDTGIITNHSIYNFKRFIDLRGVKNKSIMASIQKYNSDRKRDDLEKISSPYPYEYLLAIINSTWANRYLNAIRKHKNYNTFYPDEFRQLPIKEIADIDLIIKLVHALDFLFVADAALARKFDFLLEAIIEELYFAAQFYRDGIYPLIDNLLSETLLPYFMIDDARLIEWKHLYWQIQLQEEENPEAQQALAQLEGDLHEQLRDIYKKIKADTAAWDVINHIQEHPWVKSILGSA